MHNYERSNHPVLRTPLQWRGTIPHWGAGEQFFLVKIVIPAKAGIGSVQCEVKRSKFTTTPAPSCHPSNGGELSHTGGQENNFFSKNCHSCEGRNRAYTVRSETTRNLPLPRHLRATPPMEGNYPTLGGQENNFF